MGMLSFFGFMLLSAPFEGFLLGAFIFFIFLSLYFVSGFKRFLIISVVPLIPGAISFLLNISNKETLSYIVFCPTGVAMLLSGLSVFRKFRRKLIR
jgi:hypothetical protein